MAGSLKDQLLKAGIASKKQAKQVELEKRKHSKQKTTAQPAESSASLEAKRKEKVEKDRLLNEQRKQEQAQRAAQAEIKQLVQQHRITLPGNGEQRYNFIYDNLVKSIWINAELQAQLARKQLAVVAVNNKFELVPTEIAQRIILRDPSAVVTDEEERKQQIAAEEAEYAEYQIPDDLDW
ncbi:DUF2058 family protein [Nitrincola sp. MINF-07-Sa-05]|uniref:DUF2058 family protein n=1 Tax=Nitrincola salilacus TaxID=3400273 RepID=UPI0039182390